VISANLPESLTQVVRLCKAGMLWTEAETEILGASHAEIGAYLMSLWGFRMDVVKSVAFHHAPAKSGEKGFSSILAVHVANFFCHDEATDDDRTVLDIDYIKEQELEGKIRGWKALLHS
jgi:HD-like signal output (HDOD) protein